MLISAFILCFSNICGFRRRSSCWCGRGSCCSGSHRFHLSWNSSRLLCCQHDVGGCCGKWRRSGSRKSGGCFAGSRRCWSVNCCQRGCGLRWSRCWRDSIGPGCAHLKLMKEHDTFSMILHLPKQGKIED